MFIVTTAGSQAMSTGPTDVCKTPAPPPSSPIPLPYPNMAMAATAMPITKTVFVCGMPALIKGSVMQISSGDEAGVSGGVVSGKFIGTVEITVSSVITKFEGEYAAYAGCMTKHNGGNTVGALIASQSTVQVRG